METRINDNVEELIKQVKTTEGRSFNPAEMVTLSVSSVIANILLGHRFPFGHQTLVNIKNWGHDWQKGIGTEVDFFPLLRFVPPYRGRMKRMIASHGLLLDTLNNTVGRSF